MKATSAGALTVPEARPAAAPALLNELRQAAPDDWPDSIENSKAQQLNVSLGQALAFTADVS